MKQTMKSRAGYFIWAAVGYLGVAYMYGCILVGTIIDIIKWAKR